LGKNINFLTQYLISKAKNQF